MTHYISFPGLGIGEMQIDRVAFTIFGREVMWYGIILTLGIICAFAYISWRATKLGLVFDDMLDFVLITVPVAIIGARLYYILTESGNTYNSFYDVIAFWNGGIAIYGAIIAGGISVFLIARHKKIRVLRFFDCATPGVMLGQIIGRWGNFMNAEAFGIDTTLPWRMGISSYAGGYTIYVHPTFLYESLWNLLGFAIINLCFKKRKPAGLMPLRLH